MWYGFFAVGEVEFWGSGGIEDDFFGGSCLGW